MLAAVRRLCVLLSLSSACAGGPAGGSRTGPGPIEPLPSATAASSAPPSASASPTASAPEPAASAPGEGVPVTVLATAPDARWIAYCAAERDSNGDGRIEVAIKPGGELEGDALSARLLIAGKPARPIDELVLSDAQGRFVVVREAERYLLLDTRGDGAVDLTALGADLRTDVGALPGHRALAFDHRGEHLAYLRPGAQGRDLVLRALGSGSERVIPTSLAEIHRLEIATGDRHAILHAVVEDSNKNGRLDWPLPPARSPRAACQGPLPRIAARYPSGDRSVKVVVPLAGGKLEPVPDLITTLGSGLVRRAPSGEIVLHDAGKATTLASAQCSGRLLYADAPRQALLIGCTGKNSVRAEVELVAPGFRKALKVAVQPTELDAQATSGPRLVPVYPGADSLLVDLETRDVHTLEAGDLVLAVWEQRALLRNRQSLRIYDATRRSSQKLEGELARLPDLLENGRFVFVSPLLVDLERAEIVGKSQLRPLALASDGRLLVAEGGAPSAERLAQGPLRWLSAAP